MMEFIRRVPAGAVLTIESLMRNVLPLNTMAIAMGLHVRVGIEDNLWGRKGERLTQRASRSSRWCASRASCTAKWPPASRREPIYQIGTQYKSADETLAKLGYAPNRRAGERGAPLRRAA